jgi:hypothetical protein
MNAAAAELRRLHALNGELGAALRRLISYCNTLENRLMEADGEHPAVQEAKEAYAKVEGQGMVQVALYTHPPRREWRSLSEEEIESLWRKWVGTQRPNYSFTRAVEATLKERNA